MGRGKKKRDNSEGDDSPLVEVERLQKPAAEGRARERKKSARRQKEGRAGLALLGGLVGWRAVGIRRGRNNGYCR